MSNLEDQSVEDVRTWFDVAKYIGAGGAFVLGFVAWKIWGAYQAELTYSKSRDKETLTVLAVLVNGDSRTFEAVRELKELIIKHMEK